MSNKCCFNNIVIFVIITIIIITMVIRKDVEVAVNPFVWA